VVNDRAGAAAGGRSRRQEQGRKSLINYHLIFLKFHLRKQSIRYNAMILLNEN
jgi:hypothetical protein